MFDSKNLKEIEDTYTGFNNISIQDMFTYLCDRFGEVTPLELEEAEKSMNKPFILNEPFSLFVSNIEEVVDIAEVIGFLFKQEQIINKVLTNIAKD